MRPAEFAEVVVLPTVKEHLAARDNRRLAYLACIATYSLVEYLARAEAGTDMSKAALDRARDEIGKRIRAVCTPAYEVVQGICNGTKHAGSDRRPFPFTPGDEFLVDLQRTYSVPPFALGTVLVTAQSGADHRPMVVAHAGKLWGIDHCVQALVAAFVASYPRHLGVVGLSCLDVQFR